MAFIENQGARIYWDEQGAGKPILLIIAAGNTYLGGVQTAFRDSRADTRDSWRIGPTGTAWQCEINRCAHLRFETRNDSARQPCVSD